MQTTFPQLELINFIVALQSSVLLMIDVAMLFFLSIAQVSSLRAAQFGPRTARLDWESVTFPDTEEPNYNYLVFYQEVGVSGLERSIKVPSTSTFVVLKNLKGGVEYNFAIAVSRQVGIEAYTGDRSLQERARIERAEGDPVPDGEGDILPSIFSPTQDHYFV